MTKPGRDGPPHDFQERTVVKKPKLKTPMLADVTFTDAGGRSRRRYTVRADGYGVFGIWDKQENCWADGSKRRKGQPAEAQYNPRTEGWNYLKNTTLEEYKLWRLNQALDGAA
jgi:hypothetical protein